MEPAPPAHKRPAAKAPRGRPPNKKPAAAEPPEEEVETPKDSTEDPPAASDHKTVVSAALAAGGKFLVMPYRTRNNYGIREPRSMGYKQIMSASTPENSAFFR